MEQIDNKKTQYMKKYMKNYYIENKERLLEMMKNYQEKNKEQQKEYRRKYYQEYRKRKKLEKDGQQQDCNNNLSGPNI
jgi:hypothetical protein